MMKTIMKLREFCQMAHVQAWAIIRRHQIMGAVALPRGKARAEAQKMDADMLWVLLEVAEEHVAYTLQINVKLCARLPKKPEVCVSSIARALKDQLMTVKKLEDAPVERNSNQTKDARRNYAI